MTISDVTPGTASPTVREIARQLASSLNRRVVIPESEQTPSAGARPAAVLSIPVVDDDVTVAFIEIDLGDGSSLTASEFEAVDAASTLVRIARRQGSGSSREDRESVMTQLLDAEESVRREAYARALRQRWVHRDGGTVVRAVLIDAAVTEVERLAFGRHLAHLRPVPAHFIALEAGMVFLVGQPSDEDLTDELLREATRRGLRILGIGSASPATGDGDLRSAADEAAIAASLAAALPQFNPSVDASELGGWRLLATASADPGALRIISPAAHFLYSQTDDSQRLTVETYLDVGTNVVAACQILFLHRTTLYYRLERMPPIVKDALDDGVRRSTLHLALKLIRLWESTGRL